MDTMLVLLVVTKCREIAKQLSDVRCYNAVAEQFEEALEQNKDISFNEKIEISFRPLEVLAREPKLECLSAFWLRKAATGLKREVQFALLGALDELPEETPPEIINSVLKKLCE